MFYLIHHGPFVDVAMHAFTVGYFYWSTRGWGNGGGHRRVVSDQLTSTASARSARPARGRTG
jgi:hypothetical protein